MIVVLYRYIFIIMDNWGNCIKQNIPQYTKCRIMYHSAHCGVNFTESDIWQWNVHDLIKLILTEGHREINSDHTSSLRFLLLLQLLSLILKKHFGSENVLSHRVKVYWPPNDWKPPSEPFEPEETPGRFLLYWTFLSSFQAGKLWPLCVKRPEREVWANIYFLPKLKSSVRILNTEVLNIYFILLMHLLDQI